MIYGERIRFRRAEKEDLPLFMEWINNPDVTEGLTLYLPMGMWEEEEWFAGLAKRPQAERPLTVDIPDGDGWRAIGNVSVFNIDSVAHSAEVGIMLGDKSIWNQGYGTEVMRLLLKHGFETLNLNRIELLVYEANIWATRTYEKVGFIHEGRKRQALFKNGSYQDILIMSILRSEWERNK
ncbi:MAG: GNAT family N-acetyltransferase [Anaerolineae bacterium]|jgi:RimJ/RimL family protein N-acetyltransferase|nr:GNAT family N-acetyltransferase [Anaerolineae bacterium]MBT3713920.1 GNAT family N-acetyltransferase [Anaerolineae bacterium]MBT4310662.1 GNAT family N-acetyltransferase [Anaerolineae bacterium]MBT4459539.1 GNAT family N-acetyltransferase [Anaerolineae bacterium]MBT4841090.1 GNAT family N-acetyltransferase [Anaerolineae bacterium]